jgi:hypothetical protein
MQLVEVNSGHTVDRLAEQQSPMTQSNSSQEPVYTACEGPILKELRPDGVRWVLLSIMENLAGCE